MMESLPQKFSRIKIKKALRSSGEEVVFDAVRDNNGKGILVSDLALILKRFDAVS